MSSFDDRQRELLRPYLSRRALMRGMSLAGLGAMGAGLAGCQKRPEQDLIDTSTDPQLLQLGGTINGLVEGLLDGAAVAGATVSFAGLGDVITDKAGRFEVRVQQIGDFDVTVTAGDFVKRIGRMRLQGNVNLVLSLLERDSGLSTRFLDQYARGIGSSKEGVVPRTPGYTNHWTAPPRVIIYRKLIDQAKGVISEARLAAMQTSIQSLFGPLTSYTLGGGVSVTVLNEAPPDGLGDVERGVIAIAQSSGRAPRMVQTGTINDPWAIGKARTECRVDSTIELFNRMFAHTLGAWVVTVDESIVNAEGRATPTASDLLAAEFLYARKPGNSSPDTDPPGAFLNT